MESFGPNERYFYVMDGDTLVGYCGLDKINHVNRNAEISCLTGQPMQGQGFGKAAVEELLRRAFEVYRLDLVYGEVYATTTNLIFWKNCGFTQEASLMLRKWWEGKYYDSYIISILRDEWQQSLSQR